MEKTHDGKQWYGFTEDQVFGEVMSDKEICRYILQMLMPDREIGEIYYPLKQEEIKDPSHRKEKDIRLDILIEDEEHNFYNLEMQTTDKKDMGKRLRYYGSQIDQRHTLKKGETYKKLTRITLIMFCTFDYKGMPDGTGPVKRWYRSLGVVDRTDELNDEKEEIIINSKGDLASAPHDLMPLVNLMEDNYDQLDNLPNKKQQRIFDKIRRIIADMNADPVWRDKIMDFETRMAEEREYGEEQGMKRGVEQERKNGVRQAINRDRKFGIPDSKILDALIEDYHDFFTKAQLEQMMKEV